MSRLSQQHRNPEYCIEDCRISGMYWYSAQDRRKVTKNWGTSISSLELEGLAYFMAKNVGCLWPPWPPGSTSPGAGLVPGLILLVGGH